MADLSITRPGANRTILHLGDTEVLFSYETPVAVKAPGDKAIRTEVFYSQTTEKHINKFIQDHGGNFTEVSQGKINEFVSGE